jgi:hypothetical protein
MIVLGMSGNGKDVISIFMNKSAREVKEHFSELENAIQVQLPVPARGRPKA